MLSDSVKPATGNSSMIPTSDRPRWKAVKSRGLAPGGAVVKKSSLPCKRDIHKCYHFGQCHLSYDCTAAMRGHAIYESLGKVSHG